MGGLRRKVSYLIEPLHSATQGLSNGQSRMTSLTYSNPLKPLSKPVLHCRAAYTLTYQCSYKWELSLGFMGRHHLHYRHAIGNLG